MNISNRLSLLISLSSWIGKAGLFTAAPSGSLQAAPEARPGRAARVAYQLCLLAITGTAFGAGAASAQVTALDCAASPFGRSIELLQDREPSIGLLGRLAPGVPFQLTYTDPGSAASYSPGLADPRFGSLSDMDSIAIDLNGDGTSEVAMAGISTSLGHPVVAIMGGNGNILDTWSVGVPASWIRVAAADLTGRKSAQKDLVIAYRTPSDGRIHILAFFGTSDGGLGPADNTWNMRFSRFNTSPRQFDIAVGDFLLDGSDQIALVIAGDPAGNETIFFDLIRYEPGSNLSGPDSSTFAARGFGLTATPLTTENFVGLHTAAVRWMPGSGMQLATVIQTEGDLGGNPLEYLFVDFSATRNGLGELIGISRTNIMHARNHEVIPQVNQAGRFDLTGGDLNRDGIDELLLGYANDAIDGVVVRALRYRPGRTGPVKFERYADYSYAFDDPMSAEDVRDIAIGVSDINGDGFPELFSAVVSNTSRYYLRRWNIEPVSAASMGVGCATVVGSPACPQATFLPAPVPTATPVASRGSSLSGFTGENAAGTWTLCVADSAAADTGTLVGWSLIVNRESLVFSSAPGLQATIGDNTGSLDACLTLSIPSDPNPDALRITSLDVVVRIDHTWVEDLTLELTSPRGIALTLMNRPGPGASADLSSSIPIRFSDFSPSSGVITAYSETSPGSSTYTQVSLAMPDFDGDSVAAAIPNNGPICRAVVQDTLTALIFSPPYFRAVQGSEESDVGAEIGTSASNGTSGELTVSSISGNDVSGYFGASVGGEVFGVGMSASARITAGKSYESSTGTTESSESAVSFGVGDSASGANAGIAQFQRTNYDCYEYELRQLGQVRSDSFARYCELVNHERGKRVVTSWNQDVPTVNQTPPAWWSPITRDWGNLALHGQASSSGGNASAVIDGLLNNAPILQVDAQEGSYLLVDLGSVVDVHSIRLHIPASSLPGFSGLRVFAYEMPRSAFSVPSGPDVSTYDPRTGGGVLPITTISTLSGQAGGAVPKRARFIRISAPTTFDFAQFALTELQVFGASRIEPNHYPVAVCDQIREDGFFQVKQFIRGSVNGFRWIDVIGDAEWLPTAGECPAGSLDSPQIPKVAIWEDRVLVGEGQTSWSMDTSTSGALQANSGISHSSRVGAEIDIEAGAIVKIQAGGGVESSSGVSREDSNGTFWSNSLIVGGALPGIPEVSGGCDYRPRPFQYTTSFRSNTGYEHQLMVVDYIVQPVTNGWSNASGGPPPECLEGSGPFIFGSGFE